MERSEDYEYNNLNQIEGLRHEIITDKALSYHDALFKIIIIGDSGIGKSCVLKRLVDNEFKEDHDVTVGVEFGSFLIKIEDKVLKLQIWDTAGQESFRSITKIFYRGAHTAILGYSITQRDTFDNLEDWLREAKSSCQPDVLMTLIGNKSDLEQKRQVSHDEGLMFKKKNNLLYFTETSAKNGDNIDKMFIDLAKFIYLKYKDQLHNMIDDETSSQNSRSNSFDQNQMKNGMGQGQNQKMNQMRLRGKLRQQQKDTGCKC
eukprot:403344431